MMKASDMIQQHCCGQLGEKEVYLQMVKDLEQEVEFLKLKVTELRVKVNNSVTKSEYRKLLASVNREEK